MNIGIITTWFERGAAYVSKQYQEVLEEAGHSVFIYARGGEEDGVESSEWTGSKVTWGKRCEFPVPTYIDEKDFKKWLLKHKIEVAFFNEQRWLKPVVLCRELKIKTGLYIDYYTEDTIRSYNIFDFLICNTKKHLAAFDWHDQVYYSPWGTDVNIFNTSNLRRREEKIRFFTSAGMNPYRKGTDLVINAFFCAQQNKNFKEAAVLIIHTQKPLVDYFTGLDGQNSTIENIYKLQQSNSLVIIERTVKAPGLYHMGDIYVYPSRLDGIGLTIAEAISCGMPVIVPDDAPMNEFLPDVGSVAIGINKFFCRSDGYYWPQNEVSIQELTQAMIHYNEEKHKLDDYALASRDFALKNLNWHSNASNLPEIFTTSRRRFVTSEDEKKALLAFTSKYPLIVRYTIVYRLIYSLKRFLGNLIS